MSDPETLGVYAARAAEYEKLVSNDAPDADLQRFIDGVTPGGTVLDLGCGPGNSARFMAEAGLVAHAWDPVAEMRTLAAAHDGVSVRDAGYDDLDAVATFDGIWCNFSMLHTPLADWPRHFGAIHRALKPGGLFHFGTKLGEGETRDKIGRLYSYMTEPELADLLADTGFALEYTRTGEEAGLSGEVAPFVILQARA